MKKLEFPKTLLMSAAGLLLSAVMWAQADKASRPSPPATATGIVNGAAITINYSSPSVKGRKIYGGQVPFDKVWRAGANEATLFETNKAIRVEGLSLPAGKYSLYAIPGQKQWTIILNSETGQWGVKRSGESSRNPAKDVLSVKVKPVKTSTLSEKLVYDVTKKGFVLRWENTSVPVTIR